MAQTALITGAANGIGRQLALHLARDGYRIAGVDLDGEGLRSLASELGTAPCATALADVTDAAALAKAVRELEGKVGPTTLLIANAGIAIETSALDFGAVDFERVIRVNLLGVSNSVAAVLPGMIERRTGHLVGLSSVASFHGLPRLIGYSVSKAAVNTLMEGLAAELAPLGITTTTICPGFIRTNMTAAITGQVQDLLELDVGVRHILRAIRERRLFYAFPARTVWRLRILRLLPRSLQHRLLAKILRAVKPTEPAPT